MQLSEIHDHPQFPGALRNLVTDALEALWQFGNSYKPILGHLHHALAASGETPAPVLDLCSGGGGPWLGLARQLEAVYGCSVAVSLTDKFPNKEAADRINQRSVDSRNPLAESRLTQIEFLRAPVNALQIPKHLLGFRTMFSAFHHFDPPEATEILASAAACQRGIGVFEVAQRSPKTMAVLCVTPLLVMFLTPGMRPFRWSRLFWTYLLPVVPFVIWYDGWISCLRAYSLAELQEIVSDIEPQPTGHAYRWEIGTATSGLLPVTYVVGHPEVPAV